MDSRTDRRDRELSAGRRFPDVLQPYMGGMTVIEGYKS